VHVDPAVEEYVPFAQGVQHDAPADDDCPIGHGVHSDAVRVSEYVPAKHFSHAHPAFLYSPFAQDVLEVQDVAPTGDVVPAGHVVQK
jgi:hypothetical protein